MMPTIHIPRRVGGVACLSALAACAALAQNPAPSPLPAPVPDQGAGATTNAPTEMQKTVVVGLPLEET
ncbi:MAG: hypothetical protein ACKO3N_00365, partial [Verrucomicrobiota bacterium]